MRRLLVLGLVVLAACSSSPTTSPAPRTFTLKGTFQGVSCLKVESEPHSVQVSDETGTLIGQTRSGPDTDPQTCGITQTFTIRDLPRAKFYKVDIGQHEGPSYSFADLERMNWTVALKWGF